MPEERTNERTARHIVAQALDLRVDRFEDGTEDGQVDATFSHADGRTAALEVVADHEDAFNAQWAALERINHRISVPTLDRTWAAVLEHRAKVRDVLKQLPAIVLTSGEQIARGKRWIPTDVIERLDRLGVRSIYLVEGSKDTGVINLHAAGWGGIAGSGEIAPFVERVLSEQSDVPAKLARHGADEGHAFIWTTIGSDYGVQFALENREQPAQRVIPRLPAGVSHVWVAGSFNSQGVLAWSADRGWWRPPFRWPADGLVIDD